MTNTRPLKGSVEKLFEFEGYNEIAYWAKGHVSQSEFAFEVKAEFNERFSIDRVWHGYARNVPVGADRPGEMIIHIDVEAGRGAYPITFINLIV
jgi:hypothetical protein